MDALRMWFILRRNTGRQAKIGRDSAHQFSTSIMALYKHLGEVEFELKYPEVYNELKMLMENV
jgi:hypothetical protein